MADETSTAEVLAGRYRLGELIGRGGMAEVRAGVDLTLGREVAIKLLHHGLAAEERVSRRFQHEAWAAARLEHPNVVRVYDAGEHGGRPFIVMERVDGGTLADEIARGPLSEQRARLVGVQMLDALAAAHERGVLHRDVKPSNVLRAADGSVRVGDFGIAKTDLATDRTTTGTVVGTLGYLAPERLHGRPATARSDCYSAAVVLYEALSGHRPFGGDSPVAVLAAVQRADPTPLDVLRPELDHTLCAAIAVGMRAEPDDRFASAADFAAALRGQRPVPTRPATQPPLRPPVPPPPPPPSAKPTAVMAASNGAPLAERPVRGLRLVALLMAAVVLGAAVGAGVGLLL